MFKTIYDTFIKAIKEKDVETVFYILQNNSIISVFKMLQDNDDSIMENVQTKIVLEDRESIIYIDHESINHRNGLISDSKIETITVRVTMPKITQHKCLDNIKRIPIDDNINIKIDNCSDLDMRVCIIKTGVIKTTYKLQ